MGISIGGTDYFGQQKKILAEAVADDMARIADAWRKEIETKKK